ncbi:MAG TPA: hypothetical protein VD794_07830 [Flavisolibacter sp.]|nr:hypothetical protein [Flavisolibacter sp.]
MRLLLIYILSFLLLGIGNPARAQELSDIRFADFLERMAKPMSTADETIATYGNYERMDREIQYTNKEISASLKTIYVPLLELFKNRAALTSISKEEQEMVLAFRQSIRGLSAENEMNMFYVMMDVKRPSISSGKLSWTRLNSGASAPVQKLYQQVKELETDVDWKSFAIQVEAYKPTFGSNDSNLDAIHDKFEEALKKLPKRKVKIAEGFTYDVEDPDKAIALLEQYEADWHKVSAQRYSVRYKWWVTHYEKLKVISEQLDAIATQASGFTATQADRSIQLVVADAQARIWMAWQRLSSVTHSLFMDAIVDAGAKKQTEESIAMYRKYKENMQ